MITIMLLAAVGVVLYMKINETEPAIPPGVPEWSAGPLDIGGSSGTSGDGSSAAGLADVDLAEAPAFAPGAATANAASAPAGGDAPAWTPGPLAASEPPKDEPAAPPAGNQDAATAAGASEEQAAATPPIPPLPDAAANEQTAAAPADASALLSGTAAADAPLFVPVETTPIAAAGAVEATPPSKASNLDHAPAEVPPMTAPVASTGSAPAAPASDSANPVADAAIPAGIAAAAVAAAATSGEGKPDAASATPAADSGTPHASEAAGSKTLTYASVRVAVQAALDRGELAQALLQLSDWYDDPSLTPAETQEVDALLSQLAGSVIYDGPPSHRLEPAYIVQPGEALPDIAKKHEVSPELLAKINGIAPAAPLQPGQELKVVRGPFAAVIELGKRKMTLMLDRRYAGKFDIEIDPTAAIEDGLWKVQQKDLTPTVRGLYGEPSGPSEERSLLLINESDATKTVVIRGPGSGDPTATPPAGRVIRLNSTDVADLYDILSEGSRVTVRR
ncbi:MAG: hypothetical protein DCC67_03495 [Planctomycetota bacterium]|nr:MAG: hypothetical protein DCC67_03495 [Planctomycetota bacterium]